MSVEGWGGICLSSGFSAQCCRNQGVGDTPAVLALRKKKQKNQTFAVILSYTPSSRPPEAIRDPLTQTSKMRWSQGAESQFGKRSQSKGELLGRGTMQLLVDLGTDCPCEGLPL